MQPLLKRQILRKAIMLLCLGFSAAAQGASIDEARVLAEDGNTAEAIVMLQQLAAESPKNSEIPKLLGDMYLASGQDADALPMRKHARKGAVRPFSPSPSWQTSDMRSTKPESLSRLTAKPSKKGNAQWPPTNRATSTTG